MSMTLTERHRLALLGWMATCAMSLSFYTALVEKRFLVLGALLGALVVGIGMLGRILRVPSVVVLLVQLLTIVEVLLVGYGSGLRLRLIPTGATISSIVDLVQSGMDVAQEFPAPAPSSTGLTMMLVFFIALIAALVDFIAVGLGRVPLAGLPLLALYTVPVAALPDGVPALGFLPGAAAYIALLTTAERERLAHWGRLVARSRNQTQPDALDTTGLSSTARRISVTALAAAVVVPVFLPTFSATLFDGPGSGSGGGGSGGELSFNDPMVSLANSLRRPDPVDLMTVESQVRPKYLRLVTLEQPGPNAWTSRSITLGADTVPADGPIPVPTGLGPDVDAPPYTMRITPSSYFPRSSSSWLPVPFNLKALSIEGEWAYVPEEQTVTVADRAAMERLDSYSIEYGLVDPSADQLQTSGLAPLAIQEQYGDVPGDVPDAVIEAAEDVTAEANSDWARAVALQDFFREGEFTYSLDVGYGYGYGAMEQFLERREGFCQQFAATMAMMARTVGIPSRVAVGFLQPEETTEDGDYVITSNNVHAWPELYFEGVGWVWFEPTPGLGAPIPPYSNDSTPNTNPGETTPTGPSVSSPITPSRSIDPGAIGTAQDDGTGSSGGPLPSRGWLVGFGLIVLALTPMVLRAGVRRARLARPVDSHTSAESAWTELRDHVRDLRLPWTGSVSPRTRKRLLTPLMKEDPGGLAALDRLTLSVERVRYATNPLADARPADDAREVMAVISRGADWPRRLRAIAWPSSLIPDIRVGWARLKARLHLDRGYQEDQ